MSCKKDGCAPGYVFDAKTSTCKRIVGVKPESLEYFHYHNIPIKWDELSIVNREKLVDDIVSKHSYARVVSLGKKDVFDATTANAVKIVKDNLKKDHKEKFLSLNLYKMVDIAWKVLK